MSEAFRRWLRALRDRRAQARITVRLDRVADGNFGDHRSVGQGVNELRINAAQGYRVYYTIRYNPKKRGSETGGFCLLYGGADCFQVRSGLDSAAPSLPLERTKVMAQGSLARSRRLLFRSRDETPVQRCVFSVVKQTGHLDFQIIWINRDQPEIKEGMDIGPQDKAVCRIVCLCPAVGGDVGCFQHPERFTAGNGTPIAISP